MPFSLEEYIDGTSTNAKNSLGQHQQHVEVLRQINDAFETLVDYLSKNPETVVIFTPMAHADFLAATRLALGGELPASFAAARSCVENALYGFFLHRHPELKKVWASRHESDEARKQVRKHFKYGPMVGELRAYLEKVGHQVDLAYQSAIDLGAHPNVMKVFANLSDVTNGQPEWQYINLQKLDVTIALRAVMISALAALNTFKLIWPLTFASSPSGDLLQDIHQRFIALPGIPSSAA